MAGQDECDRSAARQFHEFCFQLWKVRIIEPLKRADQAGLREVTQKLAGAKSQQRR
jgi:hypothetical protein